MSKLDSPVTVVDSHAKVLGVQNLRVIDASSLPFTPPGHTHGAVCESYNSSLTSYERIVGLFPMKKEFVYFC